MKKWYLGAQNDGLFIIDQPPAPSNDHPKHDAQVAVIAAVPDGAADFAKTVIAAHNAAISG